MALPVDFWRSEQSLNIFRTKPCQRLSRDGVCEWRSQCQYSHNLDWPRRSPHKYRYSPELCPHIVTAIQNGSSAAASVAACKAGIRCHYSHSKEEVLYHPHIFKTILCEEQNGQGGRQRCHRYYCPFCHNISELQQGPLTDVQRDQYVRALGVFPSDDCCRTCTPHRVPENRKLMPSQFLPSIMGGAPLAAVGPTEMHSNFSPAGFVCVPCGTTAAIGAISNHATASCYSEMQGCVRPQPMGTGTLQMSFTSQHLSMDWPASVSSPQALAPPLFRVGAGRDPPTVPSPAMGMGSLGSTGSNTPFTRVQAILRQAGLEHLNNIFKANGYDDDEVVAAMTSTEMVQLGLTQEESEGLLLTISRMPASNLPSNGQFKSPAGQDFGSTSSAARSPANGPSNVDGAVSADPYVPQSPNGYPYVQGAQAVVLSPVVLPGQSNPSVQMRPMIFAHCAVPPFPTLPEQPVPAAPTTSSVADGEATLEDQEQTWPKNSSDTKAIQQSVDSGEAQCGNIAAKRNHFSPVVGTSGTVERMAPPTVINAAMTPPLAAMAR